jgi:hypothetical protein
MILVVIERCDGASAGFCHLTEEVMRAPSFEEESLQPDPSLAISAGLLFYEVVENGLQSYVTFS